MFSLPYRDIASPKDVGGSAAKHIDRSFRGIGDAILLGRYQLDTASSLRAAHWYGLLGLRLPTGPANPNHLWRAADGSMVLSRDPVLQPGFGTLDPIVGFQWSKLQTRDRSLYAGVLYRPTVMLNRYGYGWGSELQATVGATIPLSRQLSFSPQLFGQFSGYDRDYQPLPGKTAGVVSNTGGKWVYFMPNLRYGAFEVNVQVPIFRRTNGNILNPNLVLGVRTNFDFGLTRTAKSERMMRSLRKRITPVAGDFRVISRGERVDVVKHAVAGKTTLVEFASRMCDGCKELNPQLNALLAQCPSVALRQVDVTDAHAQARAQYEVKTTPCFLVIARNGGRLSEQPLPFQRVHEWLEQQVDGDSAQVAAKVPVISRGERVELEEHLAPGKVTVFQYFTPTCAACRSVAPALKYMMETDPSIVVKRIDVSDDQSAVVAQHRIKVTPTFAVYDADGRFTGLQTSADYPSLARLLQKAKSR